MAKLNYDIDFFAIVPDQIFGDPALSKLMGDIGITPDAARNVMVLFRDPATVEALRQAPEPVRNCVVRAGVGLSVFDSGAPPGHFPARYEQHHLSRLQRLTETLNTFDLPKAGTDTSEFKVSEFIVTVMKAKSWTEGAVSPPPSPSPVAASAEPGLPYNLAREMREERERAQQKAIQATALVAVLGGLVWFFFLR